MKNIYTLLMAATMTFALTSCEDEYIASTLEGTWEGNMYVSSYYDGRTYEATSTKICFDKNPYAYSSGTGYWIDYYSNAPWDYVANHINWTVSNRIIRIRFIEEGTYFDICDYRLNGARFEGYIRDGNNDVEFSLYHVSSPNWYSYDRWGYDDWYYGYSRTRGTDADSTDTTRPAPAKPIRIIRSK